MYQLYLFTCGTKLFDNIVVLKVLTIRCIIPIVTTSVTRTFNYFGIVLRVIWLLSWGVTRTVYIDCSDCLLLCFIILKGFRTIRVGVGVRNDIM